MKTLKATLLVLITLLAVFVMPSKAIADANSCELNLQINVTKPTSSSIIVEDDKGNQQVFIAENITIINLQFDNVGEYIYKIYQIGESEDIVYDTRQFKAVIEVIYEEDNIIPIVTIYDSTGLTKLSGISFVNKNKSEVPASGDQMYLAVSISIISLLSLIEVIHQKRKLEDEVNNN